MYMQFSDYRFVSEETRKTILSRVSDETSLIVMGDKTIHATDVNGLVNGLEKRNLHKKEVPEESDKL